MAKIYYAYCVFKDEEIAGTIPRNSTIPEELGRIQYLLTDKTGTLTKNEMIFKKVAMQYAQFDLVSNRSRDCQPASLKLTFILS